MPALQKRRGGFHIRPCRLRQGKLPRAHIECAPTDFVFAQMRPLSWPPLRGGSARRRWGREPCGSPEYFGSRLAKNFCRGEHCSPVPACLARNCPGKCVAAASWRATNGRPYKKRRGGFHIRPCPLAARQTSAGAYRMRPYGFRFRPKGETSPPVYPPTKNRSRAVLLQNSAAAFFILCVTKPCASPAQGRQSRWAWTGSRSCRIPGRCGGPRQRRSPSWQEWGCPPGRGYPARGCGGWRCSRP